MFLFCYFAIFESEHLAFGVLTRFEIKEIKFVMSNSGQTDWNLKNWLAMINDIGV